MHLMCVGIPIYVYMYVRVHACNDVYIYAHIDSISIYMCTHMYKRLCVCVLSS